MLQEYEQKKENEQLQQATELSQLEEATNKSIKLIINTYAPIAFAFFAFIAVVLQLVPFFSYLNSVIKLISALISFSAAIFFGIMKSNLFGAHDKLYAQIKKYHQVKRYKEKIK